MSLGLALPLAACLAVAVLALAGCQITEGHVSPMGVDVPGGGPLGGKGGNRFGLAPTYAVHHVGGVTVYALYNQWGVPPSGIPARIFDRFDDPAVLGEVRY